VVNEPGCRAVPASVNVSPGVIVFPDMKYQAVSSAPSVSMRP